MTASPASSTLRRQRFMDVLMINHQANVALFGTSRSMLHQSRANLPRRMWSFFFHFPTFLGKSLSSYHLRQGTWRSYTTAVSACNQKAKEKRKPPCAWRIVLHLKRTAAQNVAFCRTLALVGKFLIRKRREFDWLHFVFFFSCVFFSRVGENQWARVTKNKEKTRRGLKWRLTDRYLRWGTLADPRPGRADADQCKSIDFLQELRISGFPRFWVSPTCFRAK